MASAIEARLDPAQDRGLLIILSVTMMLLISTLVVSLRIYTRKVLLDKLGLDDFLIVFALVGGSLSSGSFVFGLTWTQLATIGDGVAVIATTRYGAGKHMGTFDPALVPLYFRCFYVTIVLYMVALLFLKTTFLAQYYRVFFTQKSRHVFFIVAFIVCGWSLSQVFVGIFLCYPIQGFWDKTIQARCIPTNAQWHINAAGNIATDVIVFLMPLPVIGQLNLPRTQKVLLVVLFSFGFLSVAISVIRIQYLKLFEDITWENVAPACWSIAELTTALVCASLSTLRPLLARHFPGLISSRSSGRHSSYIRQGDSDRRRSAYGALTHWQGGNPVSLASTVDGREHTKLIKKKRAYELTTSPSKDSVREFTQLWSHDPSPVSAVNPHPGFGRVVECSTTTRAKAGPALPPGAAAAINIPSGQWIFVRHDIHQTQRSL